MKRTPRFFSSAAEMEVEAFEEIEVTRSLGMFKSDQFPQSNAPPGALQNSVDFVPGTFRKRAGVVTRYTSTLVSGYPVGLHSFQRHTASPTILFATSTSLYAGTTPTLVAAGFTNLTYGVEFVTYNDVAYFVNGVDGLYQYDGSTAAEVTPYTPSQSEPANYLSDGSHAIHTSRYITVHDGVMYLASPPGVPYRIYRSDEVVGPTYFHHYVDVVSPNGGKIVGLIPFNGVLIILKDDSIWSFDGFVGDKTAQAKLISNTGCASGRSAREVPGLGLVFFGSDKNFYVLRPDQVNMENQRLLRLSSHISTGMSGQAESQRHLSCAIVTDTLYICSLRGFTSYTNPALAFDYTRVSSLEEDVNSLFVPWTLYTQPQARCFAKHFDGSSTYYLWGGEAGTFADGYVYRFDTNDYDGTNTAIQANIRTTPFDMGQPGRRKYLDSIQITVRVLSASTYGTSYLDGYLYIDEVEGTEIVTLPSQDLCGIHTEISSVFGTSPVYKTITYKVARMGARFRLAFNHLTGSPMEITSIKLRYSVEEAR